MELPYTTDRDPSLTHQVVFFATRASVHVSCNCRRTTFAHDSIGKVDGDISLARKLYNDPANHRVSFNEEDTAKW